MILSHKRLMIPLPPGWVLAPEGDAREDGSSEMAIGPALGELTPNLVVTSEEFSHPRLSRPLLNVTCPVYRWFSHISEAGNRG